MFVHHVFFWLRTDLNTAEIQQFEKGVKSLLTIEGVKFGDVGKPAATHRPVIERTYSYSLLTAFENKEGHDAYQPLMKFIRNLYMTAHIFGRKF